MRKMGERIFKNPFVFPRLAPSFRVTVLSKMKTNKKGSFQCKRKMSVQKLNDGRPKVVPQERSYQVVPRKAGMFVLIFFVTVPFLFILLPLG